MKGAQIKAILMILAIFGGLGWFIFGGEITLPDLPKFVKKEKRKSSAHRSGSTNSMAKTGQIIDRYKGVAVYNNGRVSNVSGRNTTKDGYNLGLKYQCVEFAKRFYYEVYGHKMPDSYGHAKDFFDRSLSQGAINKARAMRQYHNGGPDKPKANDLVVIGASGGNSFGHLFVLTKVSSDGVEFIQQNPGQGNPSRGVYSLRHQGGNWSINADHVVGWLRMP